MACGRIKNNITKVCINDFNKKITIQKPTLNLSNTRGINAQAGFIDVKQVWAMVKSKNPFQLQNGTNTNLTTITTEFYIRYDSDIALTDKLFIEYNSIKYKVVQADNIDLKNETIIFRTVKRGDEANAANLR